MAQFLQISRHRRDALRPAGAFQAILKTAAAGRVVSGFGVGLSSCSREAEALVLPPSLGFQEILYLYDAVDHGVDGYSTKVLLR